MKSTFNPIFKTIGLLALLLFTSIPTFAQDLVRQVKDKMSSEGYTLADEYAFTLSEGESAFKVREFYDDAEYMIIAVPAEDGVEDLDLYLYDDDGELLKKDADATNVCIVDYTVATDRELKVTAKNYNSKRTGYQYDCKLMVYYKSKTVTAPKSTEKNIDAPEPEPDVLDQSLEAMVKARMTKEGYTMADEYDFTLSKGESAYKMRTFYDDSKYFIVAVPTEDGVEDLDLYVYDDDGELLKKDADETNVCIVDYSVATDRELKVVVKNYDASRTGYQYDCKLLVFYKAN